jgi:hypothetical protein
LIQNGKLLRMLMEPQESKYLAAAKILGGASLKKMRKAKGKHAQLVGEQAKKTKQLAEKYFKEFLRENNPKLTNAEYRTWRAKFDESMDSNIKKFKAQVMTRVSQQITKGS